jgi:glutathione S-transferase
MSELVLYHHPFSRAATVVWMLEEIGHPYRLEHVELTRGEQKSERIRALNPMGKVPILVDGETVVTETAAIGVYLADKYAPGRLAPALDAKERGLYLRACFIPAAVIEPASLAKLKGWDVHTGQAGFGDYDSMLATVNAIVGEGPYVLGETFSMADVIFGGSVRYMLRFKMIAPSEKLTAYAERLGARPALQAADAKNAAIVAERGLGR